MTSRGPNSGETAPPAAGKRVCAIVVTYHPGPDVPAHIEAILAQVERVIVVDNETSEGSRDRLAPFLAHPAVELIENRDNEGIARAFNQGVRRAEAGHFDWVATFDQDSAVPPDYIAGLLAAYAADSRRDRVAVIAPIYRDRYLGFVYSPAGGPLPAGMGGHARVPVTASSGNLVSIPAIQAVGGFREDFFMACVDFEFCLRVRRAGWQVLEVRNVVLDHALGRYRERRWLWLRPKINDYDAGRRYYQARNLLILYANYGAFDPAWVARDAWRYLRDLVKLALFCEQRAAKFRAVMLGAWHAVTGRRGRSWPETTVSAAPPRPQALTPRG